MTNNEIIVVSYGRVSSEEQARGGSSLEMQEATTGEWAKRRGYNRIKHFEDKAKTGSDLNRPGYLQMIKYIKENKVKCIVLWKLDRISRSTVDFFGKIVPTLKKYGCTIASISDGLEDAFKVPKAMVGMLIGMSEDEHSNICLRTLAVVARRAERGFRQGHAPVGYINGKGSLGKMLIPDENKAYFVKRAFELYATGQFSMDNLGKEMFKFGFANKNGEPYKKNFFERMLKNVVYIGKVDYKGNIYDGVHTPLISNELFYRVQLMFSDTKKTKTHNEEFVYSNYIKCAKCGYAMVGILKHGGHNSGNYIYYHCSNYKKSHLKERNVKQELIDEAIQEVLESFCIPEEQLKAVKTKIFNAIDEFQAFEHKSLKELQAKYDKLVNAISNDVKQKLTGELTIDDETFNELQRKWQKEKDELSIRISELSANSNEKIAKLSILTDFANRMPELYLKATPKEKRLILATITDEVLFDEDTNTLKIKLKPIFEHLRKLKAQNKQEFSASINSLTGTLETRSEKAKQALRNEFPKVDEIKETGTRKMLINTKIEPHFETPEKTNVGGGT